MELLRHGDLRLTTKTYTDATTLPTADAIESLPRFLSPECEQPPGYSPKRSLMRSLDLPPASHSESQPVTNSADEPGAQVASAQEKRRARARLKVTPRDGVKSGAGGNRTPVPEQSA